MVRPFSAVVWGGAGGPAPPPSFNNFDKQFEFGQQPRPSRCSLVQCVYFGSLKRQNYLVMASIKKNCWKLMLSKGWKCYFRDPIIQNLPGEHAPRPPYQLPPSALVICSLNKSNLATALPFFVTAFAVRLSLLKWLDAVFQGKYFASLSINYVAINKNLEKLPA